MNQQASSRRLVVYRLLEAHRLETGPPIKQTEEDLFGLLVIDSGLGRNRVSTTLESVRLVDDFGVDPLHQAAKLLADLLDLVLSLETSRSLESWCASFVFEDPFLSELTGLDFAEDLLHFLLGLRSDDPWTTGIVTELSGVRDAVPHVVQTTLVEQVNDELKFVHAFEISHFRLITGFNKRFESSFDQFTDATAQDDLFAEQVRFGFFSDGGFDNTTTCSANTLGVCETNFLGGIRCSCTESDQARDAATLGVLASDQVSWALGSDEQSINTLWWLDLAEVEVEPVGAHQDVAWREIRLDVRAEQIPLDFIWQQYVDNVRLLAGFVDFQRLKTVAYSKVVVLATGSLSDNDFATAVAKVLCLRVSLGTVAENCDRLAFENGQVGIVIVVNLCVHAV